MAKLKQAYDKKRKSEADLKTVREENERLSRQVMAHKRQEPMARQSRREAGARLVWGEEQRKI